MTCSSCQANENGPATIDFKIDFDREVMVDGVGKSSCARMINDTELTQQIREIPTSPGELHTVEGSQDLWSTVDSGAADNVIAHEFAPQFETKPSRGSAEGATYITANGSVMPNRGEKEVRVVTDEGHSRMIRMQVTDVK